MRWTIWLGVTILTACSLCTRIVQAQQTAPAASPPAQTIEVNLSSPREAMFTFLAAMGQVHQQNDDQAWEAALATLALPPDAQKLSQPDKLEWARDAARQLKTVIDQLGMVNVAVQVDNLRRHPAVRRAAAERGVTVSGLFFDIATARVVEVTAEGIVPIGEPVAARAGARPAGPGRQDPAGERTTGLPELV